MTKDRTTAASVPEWVVLALIAVAACVAYWPALQGGMIWDDDGHVTAPELRSLGGLARIWLEPGATQQYYPLLHTAFWIEHALWGDAPLGYHLVNLLLHLGAAYLVYLIVRQLAVPGALLAAAIFALHPVQVETVAWITEQKNTLSAVFYLGAMLAYLRFDALSSCPEGQLPPSARATSSHPCSVAPLTLSSPGSTELAEVRRGEGWCYFLALGLFIAGLLCKTVTATLPAALLVIFWWQRGALSWRRDARPLVPFFAVGAAAGVMTTIFERTLIGANGVEFDLSPLQRLLLAGRVPWFYLEKLVWPADLTFHYPRWDIDPAQAWQWLFPAATGAVCVALWMLHSRRRAPLAGWLFFVGTLLPVLGFLNVYPFRFSFVADHFQYLACLGIIVPVSAAIATSLARLSRGAAWLPDVAGALIAAGLAVLTWQQSHNYADAKTLYEATLEHNPQSWTAHNNLAAELFKLDQQQSAIDHLEEAVRLQANIVETQYSLGNALRTVGRPAEALPHLEQATQLLPDYFEAQDSLAEALLKLNRTQEAVEHFALAARSKPDSATAQYKLGCALVICDRPQEAIACFEQALRLQPDYTEAHNNLAAALDKLGRGSEAIEHLEQSVRLKPANAEAQFNLGSALLRAGRAQDAIASLSEAVRLRPDDAEAWGQLAAASAQANHSTEAIAAAERAIALARQQGNAALAQQIEAWLTAYRARSSGSTN